MEQARSALLAGNAQAASKGFASAESDFSSAASRSRSIWLRGFAAIPFVGRTPDAVTAIADAGLDTAAAGKILSDAVGSMPDGLGSLAPQNGTIPIGRLTSLTGSVSRADSLTTGALARLQSISTGHLVLGPVADARDRALEQIGQIQKQLHAAHPILPGLP